VGSLDFEDFAGMKKVRTKQALTAGRPVIMSSANSILRASAEKIDKLFGRRFLHNRDARKTADPTASPLFDPSVKMRV